MYFPDIGNHGNSIRKYGEEDEKAHMCQSEKVS